MKKAIFTTIYVLLITSLQAQEIEWQNTIGGNNWDFLAAIHQTTDGGFILGGGSESDISGDKTENTIGIPFMSDYWIVKTDSFGNIEWQNTIGGDDMDVLTCIQLTSDKGYILGGYSYSGISGDKTENNTVPNNFTCDYWIIKIDSSGNLQWQNTIGGNDDDLLNYITQTYDGGYIACGSSLSNISGDKTENNKGALNDYWIVKLDSAGNLQWENTIGGADNDQPTVIRPSSDGGYIVGGSSYSGYGADKTVGGFGGHDFWILKLNSSGNIEWQKAIGGTNDDMLKDISATSDNGYILGGYSDSEISGNKTENCRGSYDYWIVKTDSLFNVQWDKTFGGNDRDYLKSTKQTTDAGYIVGGYSSSTISGEKAENSNLGPAGRDYWILKTDSLGNMLWQNTIGGNDRDDFHSIQQCNDGTYILGGSSVSDISGDKTEDDLGNYDDYWIVKLVVDYNTITGKIYLDLDGNGVQNPGEPLLKHHKIIEQNTGRLSFSDDNGNYKTLVLDSGSFSVLPDSLKNFNSFPSNHSVVFASLHQTDSLNDFAFQPMGVINDLKITITPLTPFRSGFDAQYRLHYENVGTTTLNAEIIFYLNDSNYIYVSSLPAAASVNSDSVAWNNIVLAPFQSGDITVIVHINAGLPIGTQLNTLCLINPFIGDAFQGDNYSSWKEFIIGSVDPNDIVVSEDTLLTTQFPNPPYLDYVVRFQNTGNDTAFNVKILNPIDTFKLDLSSIEFVSSSHPLSNMQFVYHERNIEFVFNNILLADSNLNEPASHGFIRYRIKPTSYLVAGDSIINNAHIYFDFNEPVKTNDAVTYVLRPSIYSYLTAVVCDSMISPSGKYKWTTSGTYHDTINVSPILDSVFTVNLTVKHSSSTTINIAQCYSYTSPSGNYTWTTSGTYYDTIPNSAGCDSIIKIKLKVFHNTHATITIAECYSYTSPSGNYTWTSNGTYKDTIPNAKGCDSIITIHLTINNSSYSNISASACYSFTSPSGKTWMTSGIYQDTIQNIAGCDSIMTINLTINHDSYFATTITACNSYSSPSGNYIWTSSGVYIDTIPNATGCDSIITVILMLNKSYSTISVTACDNYTTPSGNYSYTISGIYQDTVQNAAGCDSVITINLTINTVDTSVTANAPYLSANAAGAAYQWMYCDSGLIAGATNPAYYATANGSYAVIVFQNGCVDTSSCYSVFNVGIDENENQSTIKVYPNPAKDEITITGNILQKGSIIKVINVMGKLVYNSVVATLNFKLETSNFSPGVYCIEVSNGSIISRAMFVKQ